jgi:hypothetical protein
MNTNSSTSTSSANATSRSPRDAGRTDPHTMRREGDRFERLLRDKSAAREDDDIEAGVPAPDCAAAALPPPMGQMPSPLQGHAAVAALARAGAVANDTASATQAALGSAMASQAPQPTQANAGDAHTFQVSINEPMGLPLELRAVRVPAAGNVQAPALWALNIAAPSREAAQLSRHGSRLDERLRARGIDPGQVHVEDGERGDDAAD